MQMENAEPKKRGRKAKAIVTTETFTEVARHDWNSEDECGAFLASLIKMSKYMTVLEIGVFEGETTQHLINALPQGGQYIGIDINDYRTDKTSALMAEGGKLLPSWRQTGGKLVASRRHAASRHAASCWQSMRRAPPMRWSLKKSSKTTACWKTGTTASSSPAAPAHVPPPWWPTSARRASISSRMTNCRAMAPPAPSPPGSMR